MTGSELEYNAAKLSELQSTKDQLEVLVFHNFTCLPRRLTLFSLQRDNNLLQGRLRELQDERKRHDAEIESLQSTKTRLEVCRQHCPHHSWLILF